MLKKKNLINYEENGNNSDSNKNGRAENANGDVVEVCWLQMLNKTLKKKEYEKINSVN